MGRNLAASHYEGISPPPSPLPPETVSQFVMPAKARIQELRNYSIKLQLDLLPPEGRPFSLITTQSLEGRGEKRGVFERYLGEGETGRVLDTRQVFFRESR